jgi:lysophospholipid acyltransferase (LPLAT)-like uncharacterized protein
MKQKLLAFIAFLLLRALYFTWRIKLHFNHPEDEDYIRKCIKAKSPNFERQYLLGFFHQDELTLVPYFAGTKIGTLVSISKDGEIMANAAKMMNYTVVRGSSSKKAVSGLIAALKKLKEGYSFSLAVDGPRGPIYKVKDGLPAMSKKSGIKIIPIRAYPRSFVLFHKSWNQAKLPKPFSTN